MGDSPRTASVDSYALRWPILLDNDPCPTSGAGTAAAAPAINRRLRNPILILSRTLKCWGSPDGSGYIAILPTCGPFLIVSYRSESIGDPLDGMGYVATRPICGPLLIFSPAMKFWEPPTRQGLCGHDAHLWAIAHFVPHSKALGTPQTAGVM